MNLELVVRRVRRLRGASSHWHLSLFPSSSSFRRQRQYEGSLRGFSTYHENMVRYKPAVIESPDEDDLELGDIEGEGGELDPRIVLSRELLSLAKVNYRHVETLPEWFSSNREVVCAFRTPAQIRRCLQSWMIYVDRETNAKFRDRAIGWRMGPINPEKAAAGLRIYGPEETIAYAHYFLPPRFMLNRRIFREISAFLPSHFKPTRVVDFGCGPATGIFS